MRCLLAAAGACCCQSAAAAASTTTALAFLRPITFRTGIIILELATITSVVYFCYFASRQSPPPGSSLAEPPPASSPQLERWICQQGPRSARIRGLLLVLAAASAAAAAAAASTTTAVAFLRLVTFRTGITVLFLLLTASAGTGFASHCCMPWYK